MSRQQGLTCLFCDDCDRGSQWTNRNCDDDSAPGPPTTPGPIIPWKSDQNASTFVDPNNQNWQCYTVVFESNNVRNTRRGCTPRHINDDQTCNAISTPGRIVWCSVCSDRNNCNKSSNILISMFLMVSALLSALTLK